MALNLLVGGTPTPGLVIGGGFLVNSATEASVGAGDSGLELTGKSGSFTSSGEPPVSLRSVSLFADGFFDPTGGFHVGCALGFWWLSVAHTPQANNSPIFIDYNDDYSGFGLSVWVGYGGWVGEQLQLGGMLQLSAAATENDEETATATVQSFAVLFTVLHH